MGGGKGHMPDVPPPEPAPKPPQVPETDMMSMRMRQRARMMRRFGLMGTNVTGGLLASTPASTTQSQLLGG